MTIEELLQLIKEIKDEEIRKQLEKEKEERKHPWWDWPG